VLEEQSGPIIVMEYLDGEPLSNVIVRGRGAGLTLALQLRVLVDALAGLHAAHELRDFEGRPLGVVHRDVSPHNLFVTVEGQTKVLDFGIAKLDRSLVETEVGTVKGKLRYMAPEQIRGDVLDRRADVYAAGVILWEALAGERMWKGAGDAEIRARVGAGDLPPPPSRSDVPPALGRICRSALALDPCQRPATALAMADELEPVLAELGAPGTRALGALVVGLFEESRRSRRAAVEEHVGRVMVESGRTTSELPPVMGEVTPVAPARAAPVAAPRPRWRTAMVVATGILAVSAALVAWRSTRSRDPRPAPPPILELPAPIPGPAVTAPAAALAEPPSLAGSDRNAHQRPDKPVSKRQPRAAAPAVDTAPMTPSAPPDCTHPFFIGADGIKKLRPECM
jgi:hypothetical protein